MSDKILTVIVPSYNMEKYLPKCLGSLIVASELMEKFEVIVVNDGSRDRTSEIAHEFEVKYPKTFRVVDKANGNYGSCINAALPLVSGKYVRILDADDYYNTEEFCGFLGDVLALSDNTVDAFVTNFYHVSDLGDVVRLNAYTLDVGILPIERLVDAGWIGLHALTYRTDILKNAEYRQSEGCSYTDLEWDFIPMLSVRSVSYIPRTVYSYRLGRDGQTMSENSYAKNFDVVVRITARLIEEYKRVKSTLALGSLLYASSFLKARLLYTYQLVLLNSRYGKHRELLSGLDLEVKKVLPEISDELNMMRVSRRFPLRYIRYYRDHGYDSLMMRIARCYIKMLGVLRQVWLV